MLVLHSDIPGGRILVDPPELGEKIVPDVDDLGFPDWRIFLKDCSNQFRARNWIAFNGFREVKKIQILGQK